MKKNKKILVILISILCPILILVGAFFGYTGVYYHLNECTKSLDHLTSKVKMDCHLCSLQIICDEVEKKVKANFK